MNRKIFVPRQTISIRWRDIFYALIQLPFKCGSGQVVKRWEQKFTERVGVPYAVSFISERAGTYFVLKVLREMNGWELPEIICPSYTFFSVPWIARLAGWRVSLADVSEGDMNLDPKSLERQINSSTRAVIVSHLNGKPANMPEIARICKDHRLRLFEDCAHVSGLYAHDKSVGSWDIGCFSFGDGKNLGAFQGGMVTLSDGRLAEALKNMVSEFPEQSINQIARKILSASFLKLITTSFLYPLVLYPLTRWYGYLSSDNRKRDFLNFMESTKEDNLAYKFSDLQAQVGLNQLTLVDQNNEICRANSRAFRQSLSKKTLSSMMLSWDVDEPHTMLHNAIVLTRNMEIVKRSLKMGIDVRLDYCSNCRNLPGMEDLPWEDKVGKRMDGRIFFIPNHSGISPKKSSIMASYLADVFTKNSIKKI